MVYRIMTDQQSVSECRISHPSDVVPHLAPYINERQEHFLTITVNGAHEVIKIHVTSIGLLNRTIVHPREVFYAAITDNAAAIILAHNHPSGNLTPSVEDREVTNRLRQAGGILGIPVLDHVIISTNGHYSFLEHGGIP